MFGGIDFAVGDRCHRDHGKPNLTPRQGHFHWRSIIPAVGKNDHSITGIQMMRKQHILNIAFFALQPKQLTRPARPGDIKPHQARVHNGVETSIGPIARENIQHRDDGMPGAKQVHGSPGCDRSRH